jgi:hypothetical protein
LVYEATATTAHSSNCHFCVRVYKASRDCEYGWFLQNCNKCFGCISLTNKQYCVFNVQYSKEEYEVLVDKIKSRMIEDKEFGEFFPLYTSPFPYNDTVSQEYFPMDENTAVQNGLNWGDFEEKNYKATMSAKDLPDDIAEVDDSILKETISCEHEGDCAHGCTKAFRIVEGELAFYRRRKLPLPRICPNCRYYRRLAYRNPTILRNTTCMCMGEKLSNGVYSNTVLHQHGASPCGKNIDTTIAGDANLIIYCDECYKKEVY